MSIHKLSIARLAGAAAPLACVLLGATTAQAQTARDPLQLEPSPTDHVGEARANAAPNAQQRAPEQLVRLQPLVGVRTLVTDNVYLTPSNKIADVIVNPFVGVSGYAVGPRSAANLDFAVGYDSYSRAHQFNGFSFTGMGSGEYDIVPRFLTFEAFGSVDNGNVSVADKAALDRSGIQGRTRVIDLAAGPRLTTTIGDLADLQAVARVGFVNYHTADGSAPVGSLPEDSTTREVNIGATTGDRFASHELRLSAIYQADDNDFTRYTGLASVFVPIATDLRVLARGGGDDIEQKGVIHIQSPIWTVGLEYDLNPSSYIRVEGGRRYHDTNFAAESLITLTDSFYLFGSYVERILPPQLAMQDSFLGFVANSQTFPQPLAGGDFRIEGPLVNDISKDKVGRVDAVYTWIDQSFSVSASWRRQHFLTSLTADESLYASVSYGRRMRPDLRGEVSLSYDRQLNDDVFGHVDNVGARATLVYDLNPSVEFTGGYAYSSGGGSNGTGTGIRGQGGAENIVFATMVKRF